MIANLLVAGIYAVIIVPPLPGPHATGDGIPGAVPAPTIPVAAEWTPSGLGKAIESGYLNVKFLEGITAGNGTNFTLQVEADEVHAASGVVEVRPVCVTDSGLVVGDIGTGETFAWTAATWEDPMIVEGVDVILTGLCAVGSHVEVMTWASITSDVDWTAESFPVAGWTVGAGGTTTGTPVNVWSDVTATGATGTKGNYHRDVSWDVVSDAEYGENDPVVIDIHVSACVGSGGYPSGGTTSALTPKLYDPSGTLRTGADTVGTTSMDSADAHFGLTSSACTNYGAYDKTYTGIVSHANGFGYLGWSANGLADTTGLGRYDPPGSGYYTSGGYSFRSLGVWDALDSIRYYPVGQGDAWLTSGGCTSIGDCLSECNDALSWNPLAVFNGSAAFMCLLTPQASPFKVLGAVGTDAMVSGFFADAGIIFHNTGQAFSGFADAASAGCGSVGSIPVGEGGTEVPLFDTCGLDGDVGNYLRGFIIALVGMGGIWILFRKAVAIFFPGFWGEQDPKQAPK